MNNIDHASLRGLPHELPERCQELEYRLECLADLAEEMDNMLVGVYINMSETCSPRLWWQEHLGYVYLQESADQNVAARLN